MSNDEAAGESLPFLGVTAEGQLFFLCLHRVRASRGGDLGRASRGGGGGRASRRGGGRARRSRSVQGWRIAPGRDPPRRRPGDRERPRNQADETDAQHEDDPARKQVGLERSRVVTRE
ncbi:unnamed protein product [Sphagnum tenellum]